MPDVNKLDRIVQQVDAEVFVGDAITAALGGSIPTWAATHGIGRVEASDAIRCRRIPPSMKVVRALAADLGCDTTDVVQLLFRGARQLFQQFERAQLSA